MNTAEQRGLLKDSETQSSQHFIWRKDSVFKEDMSLQHAQSQFPAERGGNA